MGSEHQEPMIPAEQVGWPQRSKDTCDMCSASKVKCDKRKPVCSRCTRLDYPCFYSPARRIRKHRLDEDSRAPSTGPQQQLPRLCSPHVSGDERIIIPSSGIDDFAFGKDSNEPHSVPVNNLFSSAFSMSDADTPSLTTTNKSITSTKRLRSTTTSSASECQQSPNPPDQKNDCATTAIDLLRNLDRMSLKSSSTSTSPNSIGTLRLDMVIGEASVAIRRTSIILICPCSKKQDIGLLAAGVCSAILDVYQTFLAPNTAESGPDHHPASPVDARTGQGFAASRFGERTHDVPITTFNRGASIQYNDLHAKAPIMRMLGELSKIADLVTQFRNRYSHGEEEQQQGQSSRDLLRALVASMTSRLKNMIDEFTHLLVAF